MCEPAALGANGEDIFDILRGVAELTGDPVVAAMARTVAKHRRADLAIAFNHKQIGSKLWIRDVLRAHPEAPRGNIWILGGWHGVLAAILQADRALGIGEILNVDLDPDCAPVAETLNSAAHAAGAFRAVTADMNALDYGAGPGLIINTSCEHLPDVPAWLAKVRPGQWLLLQSNDYFREPDHRSCVPGLAAFREQTGLREIVFAGERATKNYTRFMLIGRR